MRANTPTRPQWDTGAATAPRRTGPTAPAEPPPQAETGPFTPRVRGRHRKPRSHKALLAAGGLALAAGALSLVRLAPGPSPDGVGTVEAEPRPDPVTTGTDTDRTADTAATFPAATPEVSPSSPTVLGGLTPSPATRGARPAPPAATGTRGTGTTAAHRPTTIPDTPNTPNTPAPATQDNAPRPAPAAPAPPSRTTPAPAPEPEKPRKPDDPGLCVPVIGLCVDTPGRPG
ncbi:hypothetical protein [Streptomyces sp. NPDC050546]|uniref:hypothetical protein n=1 Tax=Streptomyces sp. NPDC050546 TaxID=3365628 RepID=UPI003794A3B5